jgi:DNA-binding PadR family transcriptional regulator
VNLAWPAEFVPLALLEAGVNHGYDLHRRVGEDPVLRSIWRLGRSELYFLLKKLERRGWITPHATEVGQGPPRTTFAITASGRDALHAWLAAPVPNPRDLRAEFLAKVYLGRMLAAPEVSELLHSQSKILEKRLDRLQQGAQQAGFGRYVHLLRLLQTEAALKWLAELDGESPVGRAPTTDSHTQCPAI